MSATLQDIARKHGKSTEEVRGALSLVGYNPRSVSAVAAIPDDIQQKLEAHWLSQTEAATEARKETVRPAQKRLVGSAEVVSRKRRTFVRPDAAKKAVVKKPSAKKAEEEAAAKAEAEAKAKAAAEAAEAAKTKAAAKAEGEKDAPRGRARKGAKPKSKTDAEQIREFQIAQQAGRGKKPKADEETPEPEAAVVAPQESKPDESSSPLPPTRLSTRLWPQRLRSRRLRPRRLRPQRLPRRLSFRLPRRKSKRLRGKRLRGKGLRRRRLRGKKLRGRKLRGRLREARRKQGPSPGRSRRLRPTLKPGRMFGGWRRGSLTRRRRPRALVRCRWREGWRMTMTRGFVRAEGGGGPSPLTKRLCVAGVASAKGRRRVRGPRRRRMFTGFNCPRVRLRGRFGFRRRFRCRIWRTSWR